MIEVVLLLVACGLFYWFIIAPKNSQIDQQNKILSEIQAEEQKISGTVADLKTMVRQLSDNPKQISDLEEAMPLNAKTLSFRTLLENLSQSVGLSVSTVNVSDNTGEPWAGNKELLAKPYAVSRSVQKLSGSVAVIGTYSQIITFLEKLQTSGRVININSVNINSSDNGNLSATLTLEAFYLAPIAKK